MGGQIELSLRGAAAATLATLVMLIGGTGTAHAAFGLLDEFEPGGDWWAIPTDVAIGPQGHVYLLHSSHISRYEPGEGTHDVIASPGSGDGEFDNAQSIAIDSAGNLYVADTDNQRVQKLDADGRFISKWGAPGVAPGEFFDPAAVAIDSAGRVFVAETGNDRVQVFDSAGTYLDGWGAPGSGPAQFDDPTGIAVGDGQVFVTDSGNQRIQAFATNGTLIRSWGSPGKRVGQFGEPVDVDVAPSGDVYVADDGTNDRVQVFSDQGAFIRKFGCSGLGAGQLTSPIGVAVGADERVYVASLAGVRLVSFGRLQVFGNPGARLPCKKVVFKARPSQPLRRLTARVGCPKVACRFTIAGSVHVDDSHARLRRRTLWLIAGERQRIRLRLRGGGTALARFDELLRRSPERKRVVLRYATATDADNNFARAGCWIDPVTSGQQRSKRHSIAPAPPGCPGWGYVD